METIGVIGPGAMGCLFAAKIFYAGYDVTLIDKYPERADRISEFGIDVKGIHENYTAYVPCVSPQKSSKPFDLVLMCVKAYATEEAAQMHKHRISKHTAVLTLQNGYGNVDAMSRHIPRDQILAGITTHGVNALKPGSIRHAGVGDTFIGELDGSITERLVWVKNVLEQGGFDTTLTETVDSLIFTKLLVNVGINALTGLLRIKNGQLLEYDETKDIMRRAVAEGLLVADKKQMGLDHTKVYERVEQVARNTAQNRSSMLMDILREQRTEIDFINGAIVKLGRELGVDTPVNTVIHHLVKSLEKTYSFRETLS